MKQRKIAVVVPKYGLVGGGERFASEVTERLARNDQFNVHVFANQWVSNSDRITFHRIPQIRFPRFLRPLSFAWLAQSMINREQFDVVHSHDRILHADVFSLHCVPHRGWTRDVRKKRPSLFDRSMIAVEKKMIANGGSSFFMPVSSIAMAAFEREYEVLPGHWEICHPGVETERFSTPDRSECRAEIRGRFGIDDGDLLILFVGMNFEVKGLDTIIAAVAKAMSLRPDAGIRLLVVGRGDHQKYLRIAASLGVADNIIFAGTQQKGIERFYRAADLFMMLSTFDTFGMVVLEAMAAGLPVILSPNVGAKDVIEEGSSGFVLQDGRDCGKAAESIVNLLDRRQREEMGKAALRAASSCDWELLAERMRRIYESTKEKKGIR